MPPPTLRAWSVRVALLLLCAAGLSALYSLPPPLSAMQPRVVAAIIVQGELRDLGAGSSAIPAPAGEIHYFALRQDGGGDLVLGVSGAEAITQLQAAATFHERQTVTIAGSGIYATDGRVVR